MRFRAKPEAPRDRTKRGSKAIALLKTDNGFIIRSPP